MVTTNCRTDPSMHDISSRLLTVAAVLGAVGGLFGLAGLTVALSAAVSAWRQWHRRVDLTPSEMAHLKWEQAKAAAQAGGEAWRKTEQAQYSPRGGRAMH